MLTHVGQSLLHCRSRFACIVRLVITGAYRLPVEAQYSCAGSWLSRQLVGIPIKAQNSCRPFVGRLKPQPSVVVC